MNRIAKIVAVLTYITATACGGAPMETPAPVVVDDPTVDAAPPIEGDAGTLSPDAAPVTAPDSAPSTSPDAAPDAAPTPDPVPPRADAAPPSVDAAKPVVDAGRDVAPDAGSTGPAPICNSPSPACVTAQHDDDLIRATFTAPCAPDGLAKCGGLEQPDHIVETLPIICKAGAWRLAGGWYGGAWIGGHDCSQGCASGQICDP